VPASRVQMAVWVTCIGGFVAGCGDFTFDLMGYALVGRCRLTCRNPY